MTLTGMAAIGNITLAMSALIVGLCAGCNSSSSSGSAATPDATAKPAAPATPAATLKLGAPKAPDTSAEPGRCAQDTDCRLLSDYCTGCDCRALLQDEPPPPCPGNGVQCLRDPCTGLKAHCIDGACVGK